MEEAAWRVLLRQHVMNADHCVRAADEGLKHLETLYYSPLPEAQGLVAWAAGFRSKLVSAMEWLARVERELIRAVVYTQAAETLALNGGNDNPLPLPAEPELRASVGRIRAMAMEAWALVGWYRDYVMTTIALAGLLGIPDSLNRAGRKYDAAYAHLYNAMRRMQVARAEVTIARFALQFPAP